MDPLGKQSKDLAAVMKELSLSLVSAEDMRSKTVCDNSYQPPAYDSVHDTDVKQFANTVDQKDKDSTVKKFPDISSESEEEEDSESDTQVKTLTPIKDKTDLLKQIENLRKEQEVLRRNQLIHEQHIKDLLECEPCVNKRFKTLRKSFSSDKYIKILNESKDVSVLFPSSTNKQPHSKLTDEHICVQLEQLYANFHVLHFPSKTAQNILSGHQSNYCDVYSYSEVTSLRNKIKELEQEIQLMNSNKKLLALPTSDGSKSNQKSPTPTRRIPCIPGRPISPLPVPPTPKDLCPVEVTFKWTIANYSEKLRQELTNEGQKQISSPFYLTHCGYRAQVELYLNGNGTGTGRCMSVFLRIVKGDYDQHLKWPVNLHLVVIMVNQSDAHNDSLKALGNQFQYSRPCGSSDGESDCWGLIEFASHEMTKQRHYICDDKIVLKWRVQLL